VEILGVVYVDPVPKLVPPVSAAYQVYVPEQPLALKLTVPVLQRLLLVVVGEVRLPVVVRLIVLVAVHPPASRIVIV